MRRNVIKELTFSRRTEEYNGIVFPESVMPEPGGVLRLFKHDIVFGGS